MAGFTDNKGRAWDVEITVGQTMRMKRDGFNFHELAENKYAKFLAFENDDEAFVPVLWALVEPQAKPKEVTYEDFTDSLGGESLQAAWEVFKAAYVNFIRNPEIRSSLKGVLERNQKMQGRMAAVMQEKIDRMEQLGQERINEIMATVDDAKMKEVIDGHFQKSLRLTTQNEPS